ncbi:MAG TPA: TldD/PmbA family protein, partial [Candidatus Limnocylindrales bacterium]|nr:TldD/PmbA family protein [Candidatus Limnocylindrales bacterium]
MASSEGALSARDAATAAQLRDRFGFLHDIVAGMERRVPYAAALARTRSGLRIGLRDAEQSADRLDPQEGIVLTTSNGHQLEEASTDRIDADAVRRLADELVERTLAVRPGPDDPRLEISGDGPAAGDFATPLVEDPGAVPLVDKLDRFEALRRRLRSMDDRAVQAVCSYGESEMQQVFASRAGLSTQQIRRANVSLILFVADGSRQEYSYLSRAGTGGLEVTAVGEEDLGEAAAIAGELLRSTSVPPGTYDVVTDPTTTGTIAHEAFGHGMETDMFLKERARGAEFIGKRVGSDLVNILDDPTLPGAYGSYFVDDEGQLAAPTQIIRDGMLLGGLTDLYSATRLGIGRTANGRRESVQRKAYARMSNTFFTPGQHTPAELLSSLDDGLFLCQTENGMEDPKGWGIQIWAHFAREYRGGKPTGRLFSPIAITGYVPEVLADVSMVADDFQMDAGSCGKGWKEIVPVGSGGPHLRTR